LISNITAIYGNILDNNCHIWHKGNEMSKTKTTVPSEIDSLLDSFSNPVVLIGLDYQILAANQAYKHHYQNEDVTNKHCYQISHHYHVPCDQAGETCPVKNSLVSGNPQRVLHLHHSPQGEEHVDVETFPIRNEQGDIVYLLEHIRPSQMASSSPSGEGLVGRSPAFNQMLELINRAAPSDATVLLLGESGTGKELAARAIHEGSKRAKQPFVPLDCSGLSETLFESELFGHEKGAFTGAHTRKTGLVEAAHGGTLFLDEVGDIPAALQVKLLRLLETGTFRRVGRTESLKAEFRLVCATHRNLKSMVEEGSFRRDLYYRINTFPIHIPALRERMGDLELLTQSLLKRIAPQQALTLQNKALSCLCTYPFPGNIRELRNILERASLLTDSNEILPQHLPEECVCKEKQGLKPEWQTPRHILPLEDVEKSYLQWVNAHYQGDKRSLANQLGLSERTLYRKLQSLHLD
jgi:two-component system response regulator HydG